MEVVRQAVARGLFMNVAQLSAEGHYVALDSGQHVHIHPSSVLFRFVLRHSQITIIHKSVIYEFSLFYEFYSSTFYLFSDTEIVATN